MKRVIVVLGLLANNAMAIDFDTEWSKFDSDFSKFKSYKVAKVDTKAPVVSVLPIEELPVNEVVQVDPKSPDRLGHKLEDPAMREKVTGLYKKPDTVVYSATIR